MHAVVALKAKNRCGTRNLRMSVSLSLSLSLSLSACPREFLLFQFFLVEACLARVQRMAGKIIVVIGSVGTITVVGSPGNRGNRFSRDQLDAR